MNRQKTNFIRKLSAYFETLPFSVYGKNLCVGLSGGADSVSLLLGLIEISECFGFSVSACHFNHMIRGAEADRDEKFCKELCKSKSIKIFCGRDDVPAYSKTYKLSIEDAARECRYAFFERICSKKSVDYCVTAHNKNDDAETLLFNLIRGSGSNGGSAIAPYTQSILRPLLKIDREEIESYLKENGQIFVTDSTNLSNEYTRNFLRNIIIPEMKKVNPSVVDAFSRYADSCRNDREYFDLVVAESLECDLRSLPKAVRDRIIIKKYNDFSGVHLNSVMITKIENAIFSNKRICLPLYKNTEAIIENGFVSFANMAENDIVEYNFQNLNIGNNFVFDNRILVDIFDKPFENINVNKLYTTAYISFDKISGAIKVRNRRIGDEILINGMHKSLKKLFIEKKIPKEYRDIIPIIFDDEGIIYVPFIGVSDRVHDASALKKLYFRIVFNTIDKERWSIAYE